MKVKSESDVAQLGRHFATPWTAAHQAPPSMGFPRQEYWSGVPLPSPMTTIGPCEILRLSFQQVFLVLDGWQLRCFLPFAFLSQSFLLLIINDPVAIAAEKTMATHCSVLAWRIPGTEEPGGLPSMGSHRVRHD